MTPQDAVFLALAAALFVERPRGWQFICLAPVIAWGAGELPLGDLRALVVALVVGLPALRFAPVALLLALPEYPDLVSATISASTWLASLCVVDAMRGRLDTEAIPSRLRGAPIRLLTVGILYYVLLPVFYL